MYQINITLPVKDNDGNSNQEAINSILHNIVKQYNGYSTTQILGAWYNNEDNQIYYDESVQASVIVDSQEQVNEIKQQAVTWAVQLKQYSLLVTVQPLEVSFIDGIKQEQAA